MICQMIPGNLSNGVRQANIYPDETLFIDDLKENCETAEKLGIHTFQNVKFDDWLSLRF